MRAVYDEQEQCWRCLNCDKNFIDDKAIATNHAVLTDTLKLSVSSKIQTANR